MSGRPRTGGPRVGFFGRLGSGNYGNDGSFEGLLIGLRRFAPLLVADVMCSGPDVMTRRYGLPAAAMHWDLGGHADRGGRVTRRIRTALRVGTGVAVDAWRTGRWVRGHDAVTEDGKHIVQPELNQRFELVRIGNKGRERFVDTPEIDMLELAVCYSGGGFADRDAHSQWQQLGHRDTSANLFLHFP